ncbi:MAG: hypothetical protein AAFW70_17900 [Cyanobacteria bacterium J06635_10]
MIINDLNYLKATNEEVFGGYYGDFSFNVEGDLDLDIDVDLDFDKNVDIDINAIASGIIVSGNTAFFTTGAVLPPCTSSPECFQIVAVGCPATPDHMFDRTFTGYAATN